MKLLIGIWLLCFSSLSLASEFVLEGTLALGAEGELIKALHMAQPDETISITINGRGGSRREAFMIIREMLTSKAHVEVIVINKALSSHALIALAADSLVVEREALFLYHLAQRKNERLAIDAQGESLRRVNEGILVYIETRAPKLFFARDRMVYREGGDVMFMGYEIIRRVSSAIAL